MNRQKEENQKLTIEKLKAYKRLEKLSDEDAIKAIDAIEKISILMFKTIKRVQAENNK